MERKFVCIALVTVMLLSTSFIAGCTDPFSNRKGSCPQCGCRYHGTRFDPGQQAQLTLTGDDLLHASAFTKTDFHLELPTTDYRFKFSKVIPATNSTPQMIIYNISFAGPTDVDSSFKVPMRVWTNYSVELSSYSNQDTYVQNRTFFNGSNVIKVKLWNDQDGDMLNMTVDPAIPGIDVKKSVGRDNILKVNTTQWNFDIEVDNGMLCID
jgi:hypothetical protein